MTTMHARRPASVSAVMLATYESLLRFYPSAYRQQFGEEMFAVFCEVDAEARDRGLFVRVKFCLREIGGLFRGALAEHTRQIFGRRMSFPLSPRRFTMRSEFRFPKSTTVLMVLILGGVVLTIEKAKAIRASLPDTNPQLPPIRPEHFTFFPTIALMLAFFYAAGLLGWAILFALRRSGVHRLTELPDAGK
jgi:hypothetical protein